MPQRCIYVKERQVLLFAKAEKVADAASVSVSHIIVLALKRFLTPDSGDSNGT